MIEWVLLECNESHLDFCWRSIKKVGGCTIKGCLGTNYGSEYTFESPTNAALSFEQLEAPIILNGTCCSLSVGEIDESSFQCSLSPLPTNSNAVYLPLQLYFQRRRTGEFSVFLCQAPHPNSDPVENASEFEIKLQLCRSFFNLSRILLRFTAVGCCASIVKD